jgi:type IV secretory pathway VirB10-like protein
MKTLEWRVNERSRTNMRECNTRNTPVGAITCFKRAATMSIIDPSTSFSVTRDAATRVNETETPNLKPQTTNPRPQTPNHKPQTPNPKPQTCQMLQRRRLALKHEPTQLQLAPRHEHKGHHKDGEGRDLGLEHSVDGRRARARDV